MNQFCLNFQVSFLQTHGYYINNKFILKDCGLSDNYYVYKMARRGRGDCVGIVPYSTGNPKGACYGVDNYQETLVGPAPYDVIWNQAILFRKKNQH